MPIYGIDISHHQGSFDVARAAREGVEFFIFKATEGSGFVDSRFAENLAKGRAAGKLVAAYHYVRSNASAAAQALNILRVVPLDVPVILDVEANSGGIQLTRNIIGDLRGAGYRVPLLYLPRWYWQQIGSPSLAGLPPLWSSRYPDNVRGSLADEYADVPAHYWNGYGGLSVAVLQFTSSAIVAGRSPIDGNAYRGTRAQLAALLGGEEDDVSFSEELAVPAGPNVGKKFTAGTMLAWTNYYAAENNTRLVAVQAAVAAIANDQDITPDMLNAAVDRAVAEHTPTADQIAAAQLPHITAAVHEALDDDNADLAADIVRRIGEKLGAG